MAYIYQIENDINHKLYVGKTELTIEQRFAQHCKDAFRQKMEKRPLYDAMQKYGVEHFHISILEETSDPDEREIFWIEQLNTFKNGYNATKGGDGKHYCDYELVYSLYQEGKNQKEISKLLHYDEKTVRKILNNFQISHEDRNKRGRIKLSQKVLQLDKNTEEILAIYPSISEALRQFGVTNSGHISDVCQGKRKTAYGYKWKYTK